MAEQDGGATESGTTDKGSEKKPSPPGAFEKRFESFLFGTRWIAAPIYLGLAFGLVMLLSVFLKELRGEVSKLPNLDSHQAIIAVLGFIDIALVTNLLLMVIFVGYEHFVSKLDIEGKDLEPDRQVWIARESFAGLKLKLFASIIGITGIELLKAFMQIRKSGVQALNPTEISWLIGIHITFLFTALISAIADRLSPKVADEDLAESADSAPVAKAR